MRTAEKVCTECGKPFTPTGHAAKYCPDCQPECIRRTHLTASKQWRIDGSRYGRCQRCGCRNDRPGRVLCSFCNRKQVLYQNEYRREKNRRELEERLERLYANR